MNRLPVEKRVAVVSALVEGNSLRATARMTGVARMTIEKLVRDLGAACMAYHDANVRGLKSKRIQADEIWSFVGAKQRNVPEDKKAIWGDVWTWTCIDSDSKLIISYLVGQRTQSDAYEFMRDVAGRLTQRVQLSTDGLPQYLNAVDYAFATEVDYGQIVKIFGNLGNRGRYSPGLFISAQRATIVGKPDPAYISTSHVERNNLTMRMSMRRFTRLTNGFSKKIEMHALTVALHFMHYNFCRIHGSLRVTPAMESGLSRHVWSIEELIALLEPIRQSASA